VIEGRFAVDEADTTLAASVFGRALKPGGYVSGQDRLPGLCVEENVKVHGSSLVRLV
jgi:hypothetical protein